MGDAGLNTLSMEELSELHRLNKQMITKLEDENRMYKKQIRGFGPGAELASGLNIIERPDGLTNLEEVKRTLRNDISILRRRLDETAELTGISIKHLEESVNVADGNSCKSVGFVLQVLGTDIVLKCEIEDVSSESGKDSDGGMVTWLEFQITREMNEDIGSAIRPTTQEAAIHPILSLIKSYLQSVTERNRLFRHFIELYPNSVDHWKRENCCGLKISTQDVRQPTFVIEWDFKLQENYRYTSDVRLLVKYSEELKSKDSKGVLDSAPEMFTHMTSLLGLEKAMDRLIRMVVSQGEDIMSSEELQSSQRLDVGD